MPRTALIVPVTEAAAYYDLPNGVPAHVTILFPFADAAAVDEASVAELVGRFRAFDFTLDRLEHFEDGTAWLRPVPSAPFVDLTAAVMERFPGHAPYEGAFDEVIPHVTVTREDAQLPIACRATEVWLLEEQEPGGTFATRLRMPFG
jgi:hypothetical protein